MKTVTNTITFIRCTGPKNQGATARSREVPLLRHPGLEHRQGARNIRSQVQDHRLRHFHEKVFEPHGHTRARSHSDAFRSALREKKERKGLFFKKRSFFKFS